jgi:hypothetical protein
MRYMLDTNIISDLVRNPQGKAAKRIAQVGGDSICTSIVVAAELRYGCRKSGSARLSKAVEDLPALRADLPHKGGGGARGAGAASWRNESELHESHMRSPCAAGPRYAEIELASAENSIGSDLRRSLG